MHHSISKQSSVSASRFLRFALVAIPLLLLAGCGPPWRVIRASMPSALRGQTLVGVSFDWSRASYGGQNEQTWLANQPPDDVQAYMEVKNAIMQTYMNELASQLGARGVQVVGSTGAEPVQLVVAPTTFQMGFYRFVMNQNSRLDAILAWSVGGQVLDEIEVRSEVAATMQDAAILGRMTQAAVRIARLSAEFYRRAQSS
jgi:hypothetical protein